MCVCVCVCVCVCYGSFDTDLNQVIACRKLKFTKPPLTVSFHYPKRYMLYNRFLTHKNTKVKVRSLDTDTD